MTWILFCPLYILIHNSFIGWAGQGIFLIFDIQLMPFLFFFFFPLDQVERIFLILRSKEDATDYAYLPVSISCRCKTLFGQH